MPNRAAPAFGVMTRPPITEPFWTVVIQTVDRLSVVGIAPRPSERRQSVNFRHSVKNVNNGDAIIVMIGWHGIHPPPTGRLVFKM